jgi:hypothetical protein
MAKIEAVSLQYPEGKRVVPGVLVSARVAVHQAPDVDDSFWRVSDPVSGRKYPVVPFRTRKAAIAWAMTLIEKFGSDPLAGGEIAPENAEPAKWTKLPTRVEELKAFIHETNYGG